jgi:SAM-dependent methyltransferase
MSSAPTKAITTTIGSSHHFLRSRAKAQRSRASDWLAMETLLTTSSTARARPRERGGLWRACRRVLGTRLAGGARERDTPMPTIVSRQRHPYASRRRRDGRPDGRRERELLMLEHAGLLAWDRVLWLGCLDGWGPEEAWRRVRRGYVCGVDRAATLIERARRLRGVPQALEFRTWDGTVIPCPGGSFSRVLSYAGLRESAGPDGLLREVARALVRGGWLCSIEPCAPREPTTPGDLTTRLAEAGLTEASCAPAGAGWVLVRARRPV